MISDEALLQRAIEARAHAYAPYSNYPVGAALLTNSGQVYLGANIENASYGLSICAERVAVFKAVSEGEAAFVKIAIACGSEHCRPCGACRQVLAEFAPALPLVRGNPSGDYVVDTLADLLPQAFLPDHLAKP